MRFKIVTKTLPATVSGWFGLADTVEDAGGGEFNVWSGMMYGPRRPTKAAAKRDAARAKKLLQAALRQAQEDGR